MRYSLIILLLGLTQSLSAQFNVAVGYSLGYSPSDEINELISEFNGSLDQTFFGEQMPELHYLHGFNIGARWKYDKVSFELNWERLNRTREALGEIGMDQLYQKTVYFNVNNYSAGLESYFGNFGLGLAFGLRNFKVEEELATTGKKKDFLSEQQYFIKPFFSINLVGGGKVGLSIKPYLQIPLSSIPLSNLADEFGLTLPNSSEPFWMGGVSFIFYNGNQ